MIAFGLAMSPYGGHAAATTDGLRTAGLPAAALTLVGAAVALTLRKPQPRAQPNRPLRHHPACTRTYQFEVPSRRRPFRG